MRPTERQLDQQWVEATRAHNLRVSARRSSRARTFAVDGDEPAVGLAACLFCLIVVLVALFASGSSPVVLAWLRGLLPWL